MTQQTELETDLLVIGWGKAGKTLARGQALAGRKVVLVEVDQQMVGGTCINVACVPTKALVHRAANRANRPADDYFRDSLNFRDQLTSKLRAANYAMVDDVEGTTVLFGAAAFEGPNQVRVSGADGDWLVNATQIVINTGSTPVWLPIDGLADSAHVIDSTGAQFLEELPERLLVLGGGRIGLEMAEIFARFGSQVTVLEVGERLLPTEDADVAASVTQAMTDAGVQFVLGAKLLSVRDEADGVLAKVSTPDGEQELSAAKLLVATGRRPLTDGLQLDRAGIQLGDRGEVVVDEYLRTNVPGIWAVGDVNGGPQFTYISYDDHRIVAPQLAGRLGASTNDRVAVPNTLFLTPPLGRVGLSEDEARAQGLDILVKSKPVAKIAMMPRPKAIQETHGLIKIIVDAQTDLILGAAWHSVDAQEVINMMALAIRAGVTAAELRDGIWIHPSTVEALNEVLL